MPLGLGRIRSCRICDESLDRWKYDAHLRLKHPEYRAWREKNVRVLTIVSGVIILVLAVPFPLSAFVPGDAYWVGPLEAVALLAFVIVSLVFYVRKEREFRREWNQSAEKTGN